MPERLPRIIKLPELLCSNDFILPAPTEVSPGATLLQRFSIRQDTLSSGETAKFLEFKEKCIAGSALHPALVRQSGIAEDVSSC
jgi:hypothetical protein